MWARRTFFSLRFQFSKTVSQALVASVDGSATDPYLARGEPGASNFPCIVEGCAIPDQDRSILENARREERAGDRNAARPRR